MDYNRAIIVGRVTEAPQLRMTPNGQSVASISVATNRTWTDKSGAKQESVQFHSIVIWGRQAEIANEYLQKGSPVLIEGRLETREWTDKQGAKHQKTEIICENLQLGQRPAKEEAKAEPLFPAKPAEAKPIPAIRNREDNGKQFQPLFAEDETEKDIKAEDIPF